jgi:hypothetical protein
VRAYLRLDPNLADRKADYPDGAFRAFIECLIFAEHQPKRGRFRNERLLRVLLDRRGRWVPYLLEHGDLTRGDSGELYVDGWDEWQEGDVTVSERMKRLRNRKGGGDTPPTVTDDTPATVTVPLGGKRLAVGGKPIAEAAPRNNGAPTTFMGYRPRADLADIQRQDEDAWTPCSKCDVIGRRHPASGDHPFSPKLRAV